MTTMEIQIRPVTSLEEARGLVPELERFAVESMEEYRDSPLPPGSITRILDRHFEHSGWLLLIAESQAPEKARVGVCLTVPFEDPLTAEETPMIVILNVVTSVRHSGVARALVKDAIRILRDRGHASLAARAAHNDDARISMGERWGFLRQWEYMLHE